VTPGFAAKLSPGQQRALALTMFVAVLVIVLLVLLGPLILLHRITTERSPRRPIASGHLRRIAAQAPELRRALDSMKGA
jgi:hypothetical protein